MKKTSFNSNLFTRFETKRLSSHTAVFQTSSASLHRATPPPCDPREQSRRSNPTSPGGEAALLAFSWRRRRRASRAPWPRVSNRPRLTHARTHTRTFKSSSTRCRLFQRRLSLVHRSIHQSIHWSIGPFTRRVFQRRLSPPMTMTELYETTCICICMCTSQS